MKQVSMVLLASSLLAIVFAPETTAQVERGSIVGTTSDKSGAVVPGVEVTVTNESTNVAVVVRTDDSGNYAAVNLLAGSYTVSAKNIGFSNQVFKGFVLQVGQEARLNIVLEVGAVEQVVEVNAVAPLLQTENASVGQVIAPEPIAALPLNGRNFVQLAILAPGVSGLDYAQPNTINSGRRPDELRPGKSRSSLTMQVQSLDGPEEQSLSSTPSRAAINSMDPSLSFCAIRPWMPRTFLIGLMKRYRRFVRTSLAPAWVARLPGTGVSFLSTMKASAKC